MGAAALTLAALAPHAGADDWLPGFGLGNTDVDDVRMTPGGDVAILVHSGATAGLYFRPAGGPLGELESPFPTGAAGVDFDMDAEGNTYLAWERSGAIEARMRRRNGTLTPIETIAAFGQGARVAVAASGIATFAWLTTDGNRTVVARTRQTNGDLGAFKTITAAGEKTRDFDLDVADDGDSVFDWTTPDAPPNTKVKARRLDFSSQVLSLVLDVSAPASPQLSDMALVSVDPAGNATLVWRRSVTAAFTTETRPLSATGTLGSTQVLTTPGYTSQSHDVAVDDAGNARIVWSEHAAGVDEPFLPQTCIRAVSSGCGAKAQVSSSQSLNNGVAMGAGGQGMVALNTGEVRVFPPSGGPLSLETVTATPTLPYLAIDGSGNGVAVWRDGDASEGAGYDAVAPAIEAVSIPAVAERGVPVAASASVFDLWGATVAWSFGDGTAAQGRRVEHAFARTGTFEVEATATDGAGASTSATRQVRVRDTRGPQLTLEGSRKQRPGRRVRVKAICRDEPCTLQAKGRLVARKQSGKRIRMRLRGAEADAAVGATARLALKLRKGSPKRLRRLLVGGGSAKASLTVKATDAAGNGAHKRRFVRIRSKRRA